MKWIDIKATLFFILTSILLISCTKPEKINYISGYEAINQDSTISVVIEIPAGSTEKWEVEKKNGSLKHEMVDGVPRMIKYLGYPANYGMIPKTKLPKALGGDGDPLDVIVLGESIPRGTIVKAEILGILRLLDKGEQDDKLIAILPNSPFSTAKSIADLEQQFDGALDIIEIWFTNYKGKNMLKSNGFGNKIEAKKVLNYAVSAYEEEL